MPFSLSSPNFIDFSKGEMVYGLWVCVYGCVFGGLRTSGVGVPQRLTKKRWVIVVLGIWRKQVSWEEFVGSGGLASFNFSFWMTDYWLWVVYFIISIILVGIFQFWELLEALLVTKFLGFGWKFLLALWSFWILSCLVVLIDELISSEYELLGSFVKLLNFELLGSFNWWVY